MAGLGRVLEKVGGNLAHRTRLVGMIRSKHRDKTEHNLTRLDAPDYKSIRVAVGLSACCRFCTLRFDCSSLSAAAATAAGIQDYVCAGLWVLDERFSSLQESLAKS